MNEQEKRVNTEQEERLALDVLREIKADNKEERKKWFRAVIILITALFVSNLAWIYAWNLPDEETTQEYTIDSEDNGNAVYNNSGKVDINGKDKNSKEDN